MGEKRIDLGLTALDELFMTEEGRQENRLPRIRQIPLDMIDDMPDHPFKVRRDDDMELLIESGYYDDVSILDQCIEVKKLLIASINTAKKHLK